MNSPLFLGAVVDLPRSNRGFGRLSSLLLSDVLLIVGIGVGLLVLLAAAVYLWTKFLRKRRHHVSSGEKVYRGGHQQSDDEATGIDLDDDDDAEEDEPNPDDDDAHEHHEHDGQHPSKRRYKYRVRRRTHRSRNPTLSQTGGLPPVKEHEPTKPS